MTTWYVQDGNGRRTMSERTLRSGLRHNELKGTELARPEHLKEWKPLHDYPLFAEEVPHTGPPAVFAWKRAVISYCVHLAVFIVVQCVLGFPLCITFGWGSLLVLHTVRAAPSIRNLWRHWRGQPPVRTGSPPPDREEDGFLSDVEQALKGVEAAFHEGPHRAAGGEPELARIREVADRLHRQRLALLAAVDDATRLNLQEELEAARADAAGEVDELTREALEAEARAVAERLAAMQAATGAARRIEARQKTLLHQLQGLRLALLRSTAEEAISPPDLAGRIEAIHGELEADAEVEEELSRARRAAQRAGT